MQRTGFHERKARVLAAHVAERHRRARPAARRTLAIASAAAATVVCFFLLKGATLAYYGEAGFARITASPAETETTADTPASLRLWITGIDPVTRLIANTLAPRPHGT